MTGTGPTLAGGTGLEGGALSGAGSGVLGGIPVPVLANITSITSTSLNGASEMVIDPSGNYLLVTNSQDARLTCVDISNRESPVIANSLADVTNLGTCYSICLHPNGDAVYVGGGANHLALVDISSLPTMSVIGRTTNTNWSVTYNLRVLGSSHVVVPASNDDRVNVVDVTTPSAMTVSDFVGSINAVKQIEVKDNRWIYAPSPTGVYTLDAIDTSNVLLTQSGAALGLGSTEAPALYENKYLVVTTHGTDISGLRVLDLTTTPGTPTEVSGSAINYASTSSFGCQTIAGRYSFAMWGGTTLRAHDLFPVKSNNTIQFVDDLVLPFPGVRSIVWHPDNYLYITSGGNDRLMVVSTA